MSFDPRKYALFILNRLESGDKTLDALMDEFHASSTPVARRERSLVQALVYGVLRSRSRIDGIISNFSKTGLRKIKPEILNILRIGAFQILYMDRIPASAAVNTAVEMSKTVSAPWTVRFVNAILRRISSDSVPPPATPSEENNMPDWLLNRWYLRFGEEQATAVCHAVNSIPSITLRTNTLKTERPALRLAFLEKKIETFPTRFSPEGISLASTGATVFDMPGYADGHFQVQDEAAQIVGHILSPAAGEKNLDACAGLGGKTGHIAQLMNNRGTLVAMDRDKRKLTKLNKEMMRLGISMVTTSCVDLSSPTLNFPQASFDRILLDAPCSGLGVLRRNPDAKWRVTEKDIARIHPLQNELLTVLASLLKPSGIMVYSVCSTEPEENEQVIDAFMKTHHDFRVDPIVASDIIPDHCLFRNCFFKTFPHGLNMDGFFAARLKKEPT